MVQTIVFNSSNVISGSNNSRYRFNLAQTTFIKRGCKVAIQSVTLPYSWYNISSSIFQNANFSLTFPCSVAGGSTKTISINVPDGFYTLAQLNSYLQSVMITNGYYLVNGSNNVYYAQFVYNTSLYKIEIDLLPVPTTLGTFTYGTTSIGWGGVSGSGYGLPATGYTPQITFPLVGGINSILGFDANITLPASQTTATQALTSTLTPNLTPINSLIMLCNLVNNKYSVNNQTIFALTPNTTYGSNIVVNNSLTDSFVDIFEGYYNYIDLEFRDQNFNTMFIRDPNLCILLLIKDSDDN